jgi:hypothetical protein
MANLKEIIDYLFHLRCNIKMKMVSAAKLKAQDAITAMRPYAEN